MGNAVVTPQPHRVDILFEEIVPENVHIASILSLLHARGRHINAQRLRYRRVLHDYRV